MKPETPSTHLTPEQMPTHSVPNVERALDIGNLETGIEKGAEAFEKKGEINAIMADVNLTTVLPTPVVTSTSVVDVTTIDGNPIVANDDDLIEREWVDKAKKIVAETLDNPHKRDEEVNKLQVDYIKKRFGRELGVAE